MHARRSAGKNLRQSRKGSMPFALVAVALLLTTSLFGIVYANIGDSEKEADSLAGEIWSMDDAIADTELYIKKGLGTIICGLSTAESGGTLPQRMEAFGVLADAWFAENFPYCNRGVTATVVSHDFDLKVSSLKLSSGNVSTDGNVASYLVADGTAEVNFESANGRSFKTLSVTADGTSGLPFVVNSATEFELRCDSDASILTQLVSYQLSALAQSRVTNGYGLRSFSGGRGTANIITEADVDTAFRNALSAVETICFRSNGENRDDLTGHDTADLAEIITAKDGCYEIDMSAIVAQALLSIVDMLVVKWLELIRVDFFVGIADSIKDFNDEISNTVYNFIFHGGNKEDNENSAYVHLKRAMERSGYGSDFYRYVRPEGTWTAHIEGGTFSFGDICYEYGDITAEAEFPSVDVFSWGGWDNYVADYNRGTNNIESYIRHWLSTACVRLTDSYGTALIPVDAFDGRGFSESFTEALGNCLQDTLSAFSADMESSIRSGDMGDPLYTAMYQTMLDHRSEIFGEDNYRQRLAESVSSVIVSNVYSGSGLMAYVLMACAANSGVTADGMDAAAERHSAAVDEVIDAYGRVLLNYSGMSVDLLKEVVVFAGKELLKLDCISDALTGITRGMASDVCDYIGFNCCYELLDLSGGDSFVMYDCDGHYYEEYTDVADSYTLDIAITDPSRNGDKCCHMIGVNDTGRTAYTSVFTVGLKAHVDYRVHTMSAVDRALGRYDSAFTDSFDLSTHFDISCVSGWSLAGVDYRPSSDILTEALMIIIDSSGTMKEPLKQLYAFMKEFYNACGELIMEALSEDLERISQMYGMLQSVVDSLTAEFERMVSERVGSAFEIAFKNLEKFDIGPAYQSLTFSLYGLSLTVEFNVASAFKTTTNLVKVTLKGSIGDTDFSVYLDLRNHEKKGLIFKAGGSASNDDWCVNVDIDPFMNFGSKTISATGTIRDVDFSAAIPERVLYDEFKVTLQDIPAVGTALSNIPLPIAGFKGSFDMGIDLKYNLPIGTGLMINEFESNPAGEDAGAEWVELYNATSKTIDLDGYVLVPGSNQSKGITIVGKSIEPLGRTVIHFDKLSLNNAKSGKYNGESISLYSPEGELIDSTPWKKDAYNDDRTWQRESDGSTKWVFEKGTEGISNGKVIRAGAVSKTFLFDCLFKAADKAFYKMGNHLKSVEDIEAFLRYTLELFVDEVIKTIADMLVSASVFIMLELTDYAETQHYGLKISFEMESDLIKEGLYWLLNQVPALHGLIKEPTCDDPVNIVCEDTYLTMTAYTAVGTPRFLSAIGKEELEVGIMGGVNVTGLFAIGGDDGKGKWKARFGIVAEGLDPKLLPRGLSSDSEKTCDLWLLKLEISGR